jgi:general secretion pathway protein D
LQRIVSRASGPTGEVELLGESRIVPDERSNSLIVYANKQDMKMITNIVSKVDVLLAQVLIEAIIVEVNLGDTLDMSFSASQNVRSAGDFTGAGAVNNGPRWFDPSQLTDLGKFQGFTTTNNVTIGGASPGFNYFGKINEDWNVAVHLLASDRRANVLQRPRIQTSHAVPGSFFIGKTVPYTSGFYDYGGFGSSFGTRANVQYLEVGTALDVTPFITPDGLVVLEIMQDISSVDGYVEVSSGTEVPQTSKKNAFATLSVRDGDTIILGGFITDEKSRNKSGVPWLKDLPILGFLFRSSSDSNSRTEMIILLRVRVLKSPADAGLAAAEERQNLLGIREVESEVKAAYDKRKEALEKSEREKAKSSKKRSRSQ